MNNLLKKHFNFSSMEDVAQAMEKWWEYQDTQQMDRTMFNITPECSMCVSDKSLDDQRNFAEFLENNFGGKYTVSDEQLVALVLVSN